MKIAVVSPSPVPFTIGGAENLAWGLCESINRNTEHQAELIKLPSRELSFWDLVDTYYQFYKLDLSHFDMVISTKYPAWMVKHSNHIIYMLHTLRGLYDTYHMMGLSEEFECDNVRVKDLLRFMETHRMYDDLEVFFSKLFAIRDDAQVPQEIFAFPGPFIRLVVHYMDACAMAQYGIRKYAAISNTVKNRKDYFPMGEDVKVIYPPTIMKDVKEGDYKHIFFCSRLDAPKRIDMLVKAMKYVTSDVKLYIAGTGPEKEKLQELAKGDDRIEFLGFVSDEDVEKYYANAICVPYFPYDEDYGYITIEAMLHKKAVITTKDAGGPNEFVKDGVNGFVVDFDAEKIGAKIDYMCQHPDEARRMGEEALNAVKDINWESVVKELLKEDEKADPLKKIVVTTTFSIYPPTGGGQARIYSLYKELAKKYNVEIISYGRVNEVRTKTKLDKTFVANVVPVTRGHHNEEERIQELFSQPITDIAMLSIGDLTPEFGIELKNASEDADLIILSHPYTYEQYLKYGNGKPFAYEAQDVEYKIKTEMFRDRMENPEVSALLSKLYDAEKACCENSEFIFTCSQEDKESIVELYKVDPDKVIVIANGIDTDATPYTDLEARISNKKAMGLENEKIGIFMGSWHLPNLEAAEYLMEIADKCPSTRILLMGSMCYQFRNRELPENMGLLGMVSEDEKNRIFATCDFALNPMYSGSGTNLKMFDYMSAGIPVMTTEFGTRGIEDKSSFIIADKETFPQAINDFELSDMEERVVAGRRIACDTFDWKVITRDLTERVKAVIGE